MYSLNQTANFDIKLADKKNHLLFELISCSHIKGTRSQSEIDNNL